MDNTRNKFIDDNELSESTSLTHLLNGEDNSDCDDVNVIKHFPYFTESDFYKLHSSKSSFSVMSRDGTKPIPSTRSIGYRVIFKVSVSAKNPIPIPSTFRYYFDTFSILYMHVYYNKLQYGIQRVHNNLTSLFRTIS